MTRQIINIGDFDNDPNADDLRAGGSKINENFEELYLFTNNRVVVRQVGLLPGNGPATPEDIAARFTTAGLTMSLSETATPVIIAATKFIEDVSYKYLFFFTQGEGYWGYGALPVVPGYFVLFSTVRLSPEDVESDPNASITNLDPVVDGDFISKANQTVWDFGDSGQQQEDGGIKSYYFTYTKDGVLYFALFKGLPGIYGGSATQFTIDNFVITTNSDITPEKTKLSEFTNDVPFSTVAEVNGMTIAVNQAAAEMYLKNSAGITLATINLGFLNNEGTTFFYNEVTGNLELKNDAGEILNDIPVSAFVTNLIHYVNFNGTTPSVLEFKDASGAVVTSVTFTINNIAGLQAALDGKANKTGTNATGTWPVSVTGNSGSATNWGGSAADFSADGSGLNKAIGLDASNNARRYTTSGFKLWLAIAMTDVAGLLTAFAEIGTSLVSKANLLGGNAFHGSQSVNGNIGFAGDWALNFNGVFGMQYNSTYGGLNILKLGEYDGALFVKNNGNVGIDTIDPQAKLDINGDVNVSQSLMIKNKLNLKGSTVDNWEFSVNESGSLSLKNIYQTASSYLSVDPITGELAVINGTQSNSAVNKSQIDLKADLDSGGKVPSSQLPSYVDEAYDHSLTTGNPHNTQISDIPGLSNYTTEKEVYDYVATSGYSKTYLNTTYGDRPKGFTLVCPSIGPGVIYKKTFDANNLNWNIIQMAVVSS